MYMYVCMYLRSLFFRLKFLGFPPYLCSID